MWSTNSASLMSDSQMYNIKPCKVVLAPVTMNMCYGPAPSNVLSPKEINKHSLESPWSISRRSTRKKVNLQPKVEEWTPTEKETPKKKSKDKIQANSRDTPLSDYEKMILMNKERSLAFLRALNIEEIKESFREGVRNLKPKRVKRSASSTPLPPRKKSSRSANNKMDYSENALIQRSMDIQKENEIKELPKELRFNEAFEGSKKFSSFINDFSGLNYKEKRTERYPFQIKSMTTCKYEALVDIKVTAIAIHPICDKIIIGVAGGHGEIAFWNMTSSNSYLFRPHSKCISHLKFNPYNSNQIVSSSNDGGLRCGDMEKHVFDKVYEDRIPCTYFDVLSQNIFIVSNVQGKVCVVDSRSSETAVKHHPIHQGSVRSVCIHPLQKKYFISSDCLGTIKLWDLRKLQKQPVCKIGKTKKCVNSAFFSPATGKSILSTTMDDTIRIFDSSCLTGDIPCTKKIIHKNSCEFKATWAPNSDDTFAVGSLSYPRSVEIFEDDGNQVHCLVNKDFNGILRHQAFHPSLSVLASGLGYGVFVHTDVV